MAKKRPANANDPAYEPIDSDGLSLRRRAFVEALIGPASGNATEAAQMAGYSPTNRRAAQVMGFNLLSNPIIQEAISHAFAKRRLTPEWAKQQLIDMAQSSMANFITIDADGKSRLDMAKAAANGALGQIKEYYEEPDPKDPTKIISRKIKVHDRMSAISLLLKFHGLIKDENEPEVETKRIKVRRITTNEPGNP